MKIAGYLVQQEIHKGKSFSIYEAKKETDTSFCILKVLNKKTARSFNLLDELKQEYEFLHQIDSPHVVSVIEWIEDKEYAAIVQERIAGQSLRDCQIDAVASLEKFFDQAIQITTGLAAIHRQNIIHKDINPSNIILDPRSGKLKIIDLHIATRFNIKMSYLGNLGKLQGTLYYISPEQTGRMNRRVDQRSDLYSLGITFYEMLTGQLPFSQLEPMEIVYAHLARAPEPPHSLKKSVPEIVSKVVLKLMSKEPEERYQSVVGLMYDLEQIREAIFKDKKILKGFTLGKKDFHGKLQIPEKLYGRRDEIQQLLSAYKRVSDGTKEIVLVPGYSGTGKTALINVIHEPITKNNGIFISGKFDQLQRTVPYFAFIQAINQFCQLLLAEKQEVLDSWKDKILFAVGSLGKVLTDIFPRLNTIIGKQPDVPEVGGEESLKRFHYVFQLFLRAVSGREHSLVLFIDDLQWADIASLGLLRVIMEDVQSHHLLFIGAYRDNKVSSSDPFMMNIQELKQNGIPVSSIPVKNLSIQNVVEWLTDSLKTGSKSEKEMAVSLTDLIYKKTHGNAFFTTRFLENLYSENLLYFDFKHSKWIWDIVEIEKKNITDNMVVLLSDKIKKLQPEVQEVLKLTACIGSTFDLHTLSVISGKNTLQEYRKILEITLSEDLILPLGNEDYKFVHDSIHQAAYSLVPEDKKKPLHLEIGRLLLKDFESSKESTNSLEDEQNIFEIVNHLNIGIDLVKGEEEKLELARLNLKAGQLAKKSAAYKIGADYVQTAIGLLPADCWNQQYELTLALHNEAVQTSYLCDNYEEMDGFVESILTFAREIQHKTVAYEFSILSLIAQNKHHLAVESLLNIFSNLGLDIPRKPEDAETGKILQNIKEILDERGIESLKSLPEMTDQEAKLIIRLFFIGTIALIFFSPELLPYLVGRLLEIMLDAGLTPEAFTVIIIYATIRFFQGDIDVPYQLGEVCIDLLEKENVAEGIKVRSYFSLGVYLIPIKQHYKKVYKLLIDTYPLALNAGDLEYADYFLNTYILVLGRTDIELSKCKKLMDDLDDKIKLIKDTAVAAGIQIERMFNANLLGETADPSFIDINLETHLQEAKKGLIRCALDDKRIILGILFEKYDHMLDHLERFERGWMQVTTAFIYLKSDFCFYVPLAYLQLYDRTDSEEDKKKYLGKVEDSIDYMKKWAEVGPVNILHKYYLLQAELYRVTNEKKHAIKYYDKAIEAAYENEYIHEAGIANEMAAKFYEKNKQLKLTAIYFNVARDCYRKWGAKAKVRHMEVSHPKYLSMVLPGLMPGTVTDSTESGYASELFDLKSIIKATQTLSGEVQLKNLLKKMVKILTQNAGAQKCLLIENVDNRLLIQAEGSSEGVSGVLQELPVEKSGIVPLSVINYCAHSKEKLVFDNVSKDTNYSADSYIQRAKPKSVVCFPITSKGELSALIYLENNLVEGAFTAARLEILNMLATQLAISMENTHLYENLGKKVEQRTLDLQNANEALEESHKKINDSINYASRIQEAVLPSQEDFSVLFPNHFIFYRPCFVLSGDFYWVKEVNDCLIVAAADCTGHGMPGALLSMLGISFLNDIVLQLTAKSLLTPANILNELRTKMKTALKQSGQREYGDGMDIAICIIDPANKQLNFAGAHNSLYLFRAGKLIEIKGDRMPVGKARKERPFTNHDVAYQKDDMVYLFSDGYFDQNSERAEEKKFTSKRFKELLTDINEEPVASQKDTLVETFDRWKGNLPQRDDVLVIGIKL
ncbi:MAG: AAA family ATPase [bacterium]|nr:AAA family ATPase [bacterium]